MHSGMRGGPHVGALRRCSFTETENYSKFNPRASPESPPAGQHYQPVLKVALLSPVCNGWALNFQDAPLT